MNFEYFQIQKWMLQAGRAEKAEKNGVICVVIMFPSWVMILKLLKKVYFFQFWALAKKSKYVKVIYTYACLVTRFQKMLIVYYAMT